MDLQELNAEQLHTKTAKYNQSALADSVNLEKGLYLGYNATKGRHTVKTVDGSLLYGILISNGAIALNSTVVVTVPVDGIPQFKAMPK